MRMAVRRVAVFVAAIILLSCGDARADIGLPMVAVYLPPAWLCFIPIVIIEAYTVSHDGRFRCAEPWSPKPWLMACRLELAFH